MGEKNRTITSCYRKKQITFRQKNVISLARVESAMLDLSHKSARPPSGRFQLVLATELASDVSLFCTAASAGKGIFILGGAPTAPVICYEKLQVPKENSIFAYEPPIKSPFAISLRNLCQS